MPDQQRQAGQSQGKGKILGMPRTTGLIVIAGAALVVGYLVISHFSSSSSGKGGGSGSGSGGGGRGGSYWWGSGRAPAYAFREWQGHRGHRDRDGSGK